jgi:RNA polymerase sigma-70 factor, ECF subfamily
MKTNLKPDYQRLSDRELAVLVAARDPGAVRLVTERNNQRLFRAAWSILRNRTEAEDAVQSAYLRAFAAIETFEARSSLSTWLTRIVINEALGRQRSARRRRKALDQNSVVDLDRYREKLMRGSIDETLPDGALARQQIRHMLEVAIGRLAPNFRLVFVLREVEGLSVEEAAETLGIPPATVKTRHLRARRRLEEELAPELKSALAGTFPFAGADCAAMTERVLKAFCRPPQR